MDGLKICFLFLLLSLSVEAADGSKKQVAFTFDDLPAVQNDLKTARRITESILFQLRRNDVPATGFVNEGKLFSVRGETDERIELLRRWSEEEQELGNHTYSHIAIDRHPIEAYMEDVIRGETITRKILADKEKKIRYFRHTQLRTGPTEDYKKRLDQFLSDRGYTVAPVTLDNQEWVFSGAYSNPANSARRKEIGAEYLRYMETTIDFFAKLSQDTLGYEVKQILLLHANELNADYLQALIDLFRRKGYQFIKLDEALQDRAYSIPTPVSRKGLSWIHRWRLTKGMEMVEEPREPQEITELANIQ